MTSIKFLSGIENNFCFPKFLMRAGLVHRFAIIQNTYLEKCPDMYFDEDLWLSLVDFIVKFISKSEIYVAVDVEGVGREDITISEYMNGWEAVKKEDREPPGAIYLKKNDEIQLCMVTEYWTRIGGAYPYADSYTYSLFSRHEINDQVISFLRNRPQSSQWKMSTDWITV